MHPLHLANTVMLVRILEREPMSAHCVQLDLYVIRTVYPSVLHAQPEKQRLDWVLFLLHNALPSPHLILRQFPHLTQRLYAPMAIMVPTVRFILITQTVVIL